MPMHNPPHPGKIVKKSLIDNTNLTVTAAAQILGVNRVTLSNYDLAQAEKMRDKIKVTPILVSKTDLK